MMAVSWGPQPWLVSAFVGLVGMAVASVVSLRRTRRLRAALARESVFPARGRGPRFSEAEGHGGILCDLGAVAERLRVSTATVYSLCRRGELEHHRISHAIRVPESALAKYLGSATNTPKPTVAGAEQRE